MSLYSTLLGFFSFLGYPLSNAAAYLFESIFLLLAASLSLVFMIYLFRKYMARVQLRIGPHRVGKFGLLQLIADVFKLVQKESLFPKNRDDLPYRIAPVMVIIGLMLAFAVIPYGSFFYFGSLTVSDTGVSVILLFAILSIMPIGEVLAGISSRNKYALLGALRAVAKDISFEIPMMISVLAIIMMASARTSAPLSIDSIVVTEVLPYGILQPIGISVFLVAMIARASYSPFDMGESDSELITGFSTEYSGMRFGMFYAGLFGSILLGSFVVSLFYLGGFNGPFSGDLGAVWLGIKALILVIISFTVWLSMPRIRIDKFVNFGWKYLLPLAMINLVISGALTLMTGW